MLHTHVSRSQDRVQKSQDPFIHINLHPSAADVTGGGCQESCPDPDLGGLESASIRELADEAAASQARFAAAAAALCQRSL